MNTDWHHFLLKQPAGITADGDVTFPNGNDAGSPAIYPLTHLSVVAVAGQDAAKFLQGQCTCDINAVSAELSGMGAVCNAKGRAIATFLIAKQGAAFLLVLPAVLADTLINTLRRYVLRAAVTITDSSAAYCLIGIAGATAMAEAYPLPRQVYAVTHAGDDALIYFPAMPPRYVLLAATETASTHWETLRASGFMPADTAKWRYLDLTAGIPWLDRAGSEQFIPQMLNLDRLGGIGFNKGCYTGQEVVARTQYLGTVKRRLYYAECPATAACEVGMDVIDSEAESGNVVGKLLTLNRQKRLLHMLIVLQSSNAGSKNLRLQNPGHDKITVRPLSYVTDIER
ncbi:MAG: CAF17-like 4Fe-4S cluster assembly/insertion protein YgfZ [Gammaproteobacteria bacterium]